MQKVALLGATGSIGKSTLAVLGLYPEDYKLYAVTANSSVRELASIAKEFDVEVAAVADCSKFEELKKALADVGSKAKALSGPEAIVDIAGDPQVDIVVGAIVGSAGIASTFKAAECGKKLLLANKESVVCGGALLMETLRKNGAQLMPVDSEHNAVFQCLVGETQRSKDKARIILTASGGPFLHREDLDNVTPEEATHHPTWSMGKKISVDSATLMNKGFEVIEALWLFDIPPERISVVIHPQSIVHSMVEYEDGSVIAQMATTSMKNTIAYCLAYPNRFTAAVPPLEFSKLKKLTFEEPDDRKFPCLNLAYDALRLGGAASIVLNAADEVAVDAFLNRRIRFKDIFTLCRVMMYGYRLPAPKSLDDILEIDKKARELAKEWLEGFTSDKE